MIPRRPPARIPQPRGLRRTATTLASTALVSAAVLLGAAGPAAAGLQDGEMPAPPISTGRVIIVYVLLPLLLFFVLAALALVPSRRSQSRYRPSEGWQHRPIWFRGPADPRRAVAAADAESAARGSNLQLAVGASASESGVGTGVLAPERPESATSRERRSAGESEPVVTEHRGGAGGSW